MKKSIAFLLSSLFIYFLQAQNPTIKQWDYRYGGTGSDRIFALQQTTDGGYILAGLSTSDVSGDKTQPGWGNEDYWVVKINAMGIKQWDKRFGGTGYERFGSIIQTADGGYLVGGSSSSPVSGDKTQTFWGSSGFTDYWIVKIDSLGNKQWDKTLGGNQEDQLTALVQADDGGYLVGGWSFSGIGGDKTQTNWDGTLNTTDYWVVKIDAAGSQIWDKRFGGNQTDRCYTIQKTNNGGYLIGGYAESGLNGDKSQSNWSGASDFWIVKIDDLGTKQWDKRYGGTKYDDLYVLQNTADGGYILGGTSKSGITGDKTQTNRDSTLNTSDYWIVKIDSIGNKEWDKRFGGVGNELAFDNLTLTTDGGYFFAGSSYSVMGGDKSENNLGAQQTWVVKTDGLGNKEWDKTIFTVGNDLGGYGIPTRDGCYLMANYTPSDTGGYKTVRNWYPSIPGEDYWLVKFCDNAHTYFPMTVNFSSTSAVCAGGPCAGTATAAPINGLPPYTYHWNLGYTTPTITGLCSGVYTVTVTDDANTTITSSITVTQPFPLSSTFYQTICPGSTYFFNGQNLASPGTYRDTLTSQNGCDSIVRLILTQYSLPGVSLSGNPDTVCNNASAISLTGGGPAGGVFSGSGVAGGSFTPSSTGTATITYTFTDGNSCTNTATENIVVDSCNQNCHAFYVLVPDTSTPHNWFALNQATGTGALTYNWDWADGNSSAGATPSHTYSAAANYNICLTITDATGCTDTYCDSSTYVYKTENTIITVTVFYQLPTGVTSINTQHSSFSIHPNPANDFVTISVDESLIGSALTITDVTGRVIINEKLKMINSSLSLSDLSSGVYLVSVANGKGKMTRKLVKE